MDDDFSYAAALYRKIKFDTKSSWVDDYTLKDNLLTVQIGPHRGEKLNSTDELKLYDFDPRLSWSVYLNYLLTQDFSSVLNDESNFIYDSSSTNDENDKNSSSYNKLYHKVTMPFSWYDWTDMHELNKLISLEKNKVRCEFLFNPAFDIETLTSIEKEIDEPLFLNDRVKYNYPKWYRLARKVATRVDRISDLCKIIDPKDTYHNLKNETAVTDKSYHRFTTPFHIKKLYSKLRPEVYQLQARNYILSTIRHPLSLTILVGNTDAYQVNLQQESRLNLVESNLLDTFVKDKWQSPEFIKEVPNTDPLVNEAGLGKQALVEDPDLDRDIVFNHYKVFHDFITNEDIARIFKLDIPETDKSFFEFDLIHLQPEDFEFDARGKIKELESIPESDLSPHFKQYLDSLRHSVVISPALQSKYFDEAGSVQQFKGMGHHRDKRFFNSDNLINDDQEYFGRLNSMIRTFQKFTRANGLISWLGHGTLYGYLYNGHSFPWDNDFDLQMPIKHLHLMAQYFNQSLILEDPREGNGRYIVDVGDSLTVRVNGNGRNNIDARLVDVDTGLYIDITGLSVSDAPPKDKLKDYMEKKARELKIDLNKKKEYDEATLKDLSSFDGKDLTRLNATQLVKYIEDHRKDFSSDDLNKAKDALKKEIEEIPKSNSPSRNLNPRERYEVNKKMHLFNCRNNHFMNMELVTPLINTVFHGVPALIPNKYVQNLKYEYGVPKEYSFLTFQKMSWIPEVRSWIQSKYVDKATNIKGWYSSYFTRLPNSESMNNISFNDIKIIYENFQKAGYVDILAKIFTTFNATSYRLKELDIQYSEKLKPEEKRVYLHDLRMNVAPILNSPAKDPIIFNYERHLYDRLKRRMNETDLSEIERSVQIEHVEKIWDLTRALKYKQFSLFNITKVLKFPTADPDYEREVIDTVDLNQIGTDLFCDAPQGKKIQIFEKDPVLDFQQLD